MLERQSNLGPPQRIASSKRGQINKEQSELAVLKTRRVTIFQLTMAQPVYQRPTLNYKRFMPRFAGGYAFVVVKSPAQYELLVGDATRDQEAERILAFFDHIKRQMPDPDRARFDSWRSRLHLSGAGNVFQCECFGKPLPNGKPDPDYPTTVLLTYGPRGCVDSCISKCVYYQHTGIVIPTASYIAGQLAGSGGGLLEAHFIGFAFCRFPDKAASQEHLPLLEQLLRQTSGCMEFFREVQSCMPPSEREEFAAWAGANEVPNLVGMFLMDDNTVVLILAKGKNEEFDDFAEKAEAHLAQNRQTPATEK
jgi:hypothetical protein